MRSNEIESESIVVSFPETPQNELQMSFLRKRRQQNTTSPSSAPSFQTDNEQQFRLASSSKFKLGGFHLPTVVNYSTFLTISLTLWVSYLILPMGLRKHLCNSHPKRYKRSSPNRVIRVLGRTNEEARIKKHDGIAFSRSQSSELSNSSSITSTLYRGNQKFVAVKRGSPTKNNYGDASFGQPDSLQRRNSDSFGSSTLGSDDGRDRASKQNNNNTSGVMAARNLMQANSSDLSSIITNNQNSDMMSSTGHAIWGSPKKFVRKRIIEDGQNSSTYDNTLGALSVDKVSSFNGHHQYGNNHSSKPARALSEVGSYASTFYASMHSGETGGSASAGNNTSNDVEASPIHPDETCSHTIPSQMVLSSTLMSFRDPGIRLLAHGTQCQPRRIWIRLDVNNELLSWRTENVIESNLLSDDSESDLVTLGQVHEIPLIQVLFIDVGKATAALKLVDVHNDYCFSILTNGGSLDLQASNKLERDAIVSCMCLILDTVYSHLPPERSWRRLNEATNSVSSSSFSNTSESNIDTTVSINSSINNQQDIYRALDSQTQTSESSSSKNIAPYVSSSSSSYYGTDSNVSSNVFHGVDLDSEVSRAFGEI
jgi:hypothetical protein